MRLELTCVGFLVDLANHYTTRGASAVLYDLTNEFLGYDIERSNENVPLILEFCGMRNIPLFLLIQDQL